MAATILTIIIIIGITSRFYLKFGPMKSFVSLMSTILGFITSFTFYEPMAGFLISKGYIPQLAQPISFLLLFVVVWGGIEGVLDYIVGSNIDFGKPAKIATAVVCGFLSSLFISGSLIIVLGLCPFRRSVPYSRFGDTLDKASLSNPSSPLIPADGLVTGFYNLISRGALGSGNRFDVVHANFLDQIHLNRYAAKEGVALVVAEDAAFVDKYGVVKEETPEGKPFIKVGLWLKSKSIKDGGAMNSDSKVSFTGSQIRVICTQDGKKDVSADKVKVIYPLTFKSKNDAETQKKMLSTVTIMDNKMFTQTARGRAALVEIPFEVPEGYTARYLQFKANNVIELPKPATKEEIEAARQEDEKNSGQSGSTTEK